MELRSPQAKTFTLYGLKRPDDNVIRYIGITCYSLATRLANHVSDSRSNRHKSNWIKSMFPLRPEIVSYAIELSHDEACCLERHVIKSLWGAGHNLINISEGGEANMLGRKHAPESRRKMSAAHKGKQYSLGVKSSLEARANMSKAKLGNKNAKGSKGWVGKTHSVQAIETMSLVKTGEKNPMFGRKHSFESIDRMKLAITNRKAVKL